MDIRHYSGYDTLVHRPVFDGIFGETKTGFIQIDWTSDSGKLPSEISEKIDYNQDGKDDFAVNLNTLENKAHLEIYNQNALSILDRSSMADLFLKGYPDSRYGVFVFHNSRTVRVLLKNSGPSNGIGQ